MTTNRNPNVPPTVGPVEVIGGPWPERVGCRGRIVTGLLDPNIYPVHGIGRGDVVVLLDDDPVTRHQSAPTYRDWSCVISMKDLRMLR